MTSQNCLIEVRRPQMDVNEAIRTYMKMASDSKQGNSESSTDNQRATRSRTQRSVEEYEEYIPRDQQSYQEEHSEYSEESSENREYPESSEESSDEYPRRPVIRSTWDRRRHGRQSRRFNDYPSSNEEDSDSDDEVIDGSSMSSFAEYYRKASGKWTR